MPSLRIGPGRLSKMAPSLVTGADAAGPRVAARPGVEGGGPVLEPSPALTFNSLLASGGINPGEVLLIRHNPSQPRLRQALPWLVVDQPHVFNAWKAIQWSTAEKAMTRAKYVAGFIGQEPRRATFTGLDAVLGWEKLDGAGCRLYPGNAELFALGMDLMNDDREALAFDLKPLSAFAPFVGLLEIRWPKPDQSWFRWAANGEFHIHALHEESRLVAAVPHWSDVALTHDQLAALPPSWRHTLAQWRGVYFIYDVERRAAYVGSAAGTENILGRWQEYYRTGHGGNRELRLSKPANLRFSILELTSPALPMTEVVALENSWKKRLHTREFGLNAN